MLGRVGRPEGSCQGRIVFGFRRCLFFSYTTNLMMMEVTFILKGLTSVRVVSVPNIC